MCCQERRHDIIFLRLDQLKLAACGSCTSGSCDRCFLQVLWWMDVVSLWSFASSLCLSCSSDPDEYVRLFPILTVTLINLIADRNDLNSTSDWHPLPLKHPAAYFNVFSAYISFVCLYYKCCRFPLPAFPSRTDSILFACLNLYIYLWADLCSLTIM